MKGSIQLIGTGGSVGVLMLGCRCEVCGSTDSRNRRWRPSALLKIGNRRILIDPGPDFRNQALQFDIIHLDAILLTHAHHDHVGGMDDLRPLGYLRKTPFPVFLSSATLSDVKQRFEYLINVPEGCSSYFEFHPFVESKGTLHVCGHTIDYMTYFQGEMPVNGYRIGTVAYVPDIRRYDPSLLNDLRSVQDLIVGALRHTHSWMHFSVDEAIDFGLQVGANRIWLTHLSHELEYAHTTAYLPENAFMTYDGLEIDFFYD